MDILEQHLDQQDVSPTSPKEENTQGIAIEDTEIADCDNGEQVTEDGLRYPTETLAYRVVHVNGAPNSELELPTSQAPLQVLTSPINGQFYVIGSANDVFTTAQTSGSIITPKTTATLQIETTPRTNTTGLKKRDDRRRATHNEVERRRRDKINNWIAKLGKIIPDCSLPTNGSSGEGSSKSNYETQSKGGILAKACEYITELRTANQSMSSCVRENEKLLEENETLKQVITQLKRENAHLKSQLPTAREVNADVHILP
ncbi:upstream stimulatory factor 1 [Copidosoma floridanum]|uniref:upstream stimulatory factor 1 n=1 Tax=Copidosoma floridanum TaxID=29053 RepID=UPI0006C963F4|nr:upstream stimulatory factor 1 [Copidosoma floridanum]